MSDRFTAIEKEMKSREHRFGFSVRRMFLWLGSVALFTVISTLALVVALGYKVGITTEQVVVEETGTIQVNGPLAGLPVAVKLNGELVSEELPTRLSRLEPKLYTIELSRDGYQSWQQVVNIDAYGRASFSPVVLIYKNVVLQAQTEVNLDDERFLQLDTRNLQVKNGSEIWLSDTFLTRLSKDILSVRWFPGRDFIVVQDAAGLTLLAADASYTQRITDTPQTATSQFFFTENGRILFFSDGSTVTRAELYEYTSFIDRLGAARKTVSP
jgi:hypothetical protein